MLLAAALVCVVFVLTISWFTSIPRLAMDFGDSSSYISVADAIQHWNFHGLAIKQFWGVSYAAAAVSKLTRVSSLTSLLVISFVSFFAAAIIAHRLWGGWAAALFVVLNFDWMQRSFLGGSEPLFVALLFGSFLAIRRERWMLATLLTSLSTTVRPLGFLALVGIGATLLWRHEYKKTVMATLLGLAVGAAYVLPLYLYLGDPLATVHSYQAPASVAPPLFGIPFYAIIKGTVLYPAPWTNVVLSFGWIFFVLAGAIAMLATRNFHHFAKQYPVEVCFAALYIFFICSYNFPYWARGTFARFAIPVIPLVLISLMRWIPKSRSLLWGLGIVSPMLAAASVLGIRNVLQMIRH